MTAPPIVPPRGAVYVDNQIFLHVDPVNAAPAPHMGAGGREVALEQALNPEIHREDIRRHIRRRPEDQTATIPPPAADRWQQEAWTLPAVNMRGSRQLHPPPAPATNPQQPQIVQRTPSAAGTDEINSRLKNLRLITCRICRLLIVGTPALKSHLQSILGESADALDPMVNPHVRRVIQVDELNRLIRQWPEVDEDDIVSPDDIVMHLRERNVCTPFEADMERHIRTMQEIMEYCRNNLYDPEIFAVRGPVLATYLGTSTHLMKAHASRDALRARTRKR